ncbi:MAG: hypothetical protein ACREX9_06550 [Gammaproteobacteria bacterium]
MSSVRDAYDNRLCEIYFATLEWELLDRLRFATWGRGPPSHRFGFIEG